MKVSGFTILRNGITFDYPFLESISSLLPLVDEMIVAVGKSDDDTLGVIRALAGSHFSGKKIKIIETVWPITDEEKKKRGLILSEQTNLALSKCTGSWCIYLQADEVLNENDYPKIKEALAQYEKDPEIEALVFDYEHFYGSYDVVQYTRSAYRREVRAIKKNPEIQSIGDAQSFRKKDGSKLKAAHSGAKIYHYGWVRSPEAMKEKTFFLDQLYHGSKNEGEEEPHSGDNYRYKKFWGLRPFKGSHPTIMQDRISKKGWHWDLNSSPLHFTMGDVKKITLDLLESFTGIRLFEYKSYRLLKK